MKTKELLLKKISYKFSMRLDEQQIIEMILSSPYEKIDSATFNSLFCPDYIPGTFYLGERLQKQDYLFDEPSVFYNWFRYAIKLENNKLKKISTIRNLIEEYGEDNLIKDVFTILFFKVENFLYCNQITNHEYSDHFRRIILFLLTGDSQFNASIHQEYHDDVVLNTICKVISRSHYNLEGRLIQSIYSGLIGLDYKDDQPSNANAAAIIMNTNETNMQKVNRIKNELDNRIKKKSSNCINFWLEFSQKVVECSNKIKICWFTDDFIPTLFEMKFIEELMINNKCLHVTLVPRYKAYDNDASYDDVMKFLSLPEFTVLNNMYASQRFCVSKFGPDFATINGRRLAQECAMIMLGCDYLVISGARSYEMNQGLLKHTFFTGIAVCRKYTETVTGISQKTGDFVFIEKLPRLQTFTGFKARSYLRHSEFGFPVSGMTAHDYTRIIRSDLFKSYYNVYSDFEMAFLLARDY